MDHKLMRNHYAVLKTQITLVRKLQKVKRV